jgi:hypothetical protein
MNSPKQGDRDAAAVVIEDARQHSSPTSKELPFLVDFLGVFDTVGCASPFLLRELH